jgi:hypothetical protein
MILWIKKKIFSWYYALQPLGTSSHMAASRSSSMGKHKLIRAKVDILRVLFGILMEYSTQ